MIHTAQAFRIPAPIPEEEHLTYCLQIIEKHRAEVAPLRQQLSHCQQYHIPLIQETKEGKEKYHNEKQKNADLEKENTKLKKEIEKLTKTKERYRVALFDHGNYKSPEKTAGGKKKKGGQYGHPNTNKDKDRNYASFPRARIYAKTCGNCGNELSRVNSTKEKVLMDITINTAYFNLIVESERQWCGTCKQGVSAMHAQSLPFTEYGLNTFMVVMYLSIKGKASLQTIANIISTFFGLPMTKSTVNSILAQAKEYLGDKYEELTQAIRDGDIMYNDETGWLVRGKSAWLWIMTTPDKKDENGNVIEAGITVYVAAESRGKGIFKEMYGDSDAHSMHDGYASYESITGAEKSLYCWAHVLRFAYEECAKLEEGHPALGIRDRLVTVYQTIRQHREYNDAKKEKVMREERESIVEIETEDTTIKNMQQRLITQKEGLIRALILTEDGTNNLGEREFRQLALKCDISNGSDTYAGMEVTAVIASIVQTIYRDKTKPFFPTLGAWLHEGIEKKDARYKHVAATDP